MANAYCSIVYYNMVVYLCNCIIKSVMYINSAYQIYRLHEIVDMLLNYLDLCACKSSVL